MGDAAEYYTENYLPRDDEMENEIIEPENILYLDIETQHLITEFPGGWKNPENYKRIRIAELGTLYNGEYKTYEEDNIVDLVFNLVEAKLIVGHNIKQFDYEVLKHYYDHEERHVMPELRKKTFDTMLEFQNFTPRAGWVSLDSISTLNFGMSKTEDSIKIPEMWRSGQKEKVKEYLKNDLKMTEQFYLAGKKGHKFKYEHKEYGKSYGEREVYVKW